MCTSVPVTRPEASATGTLPATLPLQLSTPFSYSKRILLCACAFRTPRSSTSTLSATLCHALSLSTNHCPTLSGALYHSPPRRCHPRELTRYPPSLVIIMSSISRRSRNGPRSQVRIFLSHIRRTGVRTSPHRLTLSRHHRYHRRQHPPARDFLVPPLTRPPQTRHAARVASPLTHDTTTTTTFVCFRVVAIAA